MSKLKSDYIIESNGVNTYPYNYIERTENIIKHLKETKLDKHSKDLEEVKEFNDNVIPRMRRPEPKIDETQFSILLNDLMRSSRPMSFHETAILTADDVYLGFREFSKLITFLNEYLVLIPDKPLFCAYFGISTDTYKKMQEEQRLVDIMRYIEDYLQGIMSTASKNGIVKERSAIMQLTAKDGIGHNVVSASEQVVVQNNTLKLDMRELEDKKKMYQNLLSKK